MELRKPTVQNKIEVPVIIFKNNEELQECKSIQEAGKWLKEYTGHKFMRYKQVENGIWFGDTWSYNGATYSFTTDDKCRLEKLEKLKMKKKE